MNRHRDAPPSPEDPRSDYVDQLDAGVDPPGLLVIRERLSMRIIGLGICLGVAAGVALVMFKFKDQPEEDGADFAWACLSVMILFLGGSGTVLLWQISYISYFYIAVTCEVLMRRTGPRRLETVPLDDISGFEAKKGVLRAYTGGRAMKLIKDAYAPEPLKTLANRLTIWKTAPRRRTDPADEREQRLGHPAAAKGGQWADGAWAVHNRGAVSPPICSLPSSTWSSSLSVHRLPARCS